MTVNQQYLIKSIWTRFDERTLCCDIISKLKLNSPEKWKGIVWFIIKVQFEFKNIIKLVEFEMCPLGTLGVLNYGSCKVGWKEKIAYQSSITIVRELLHIRGFSWKKTNKYDKSCFSVMFFHLKNINFVKIKKKQNCKTRYKFKLNMKMSESLFTIPKRVWDWAWEFMINLHSHHSGSYTANWLTSITSE